ncbi:MAG: aromatic ring-hydroxylating dioxygenase subunit alpha [Ktedonobacterales bacterium]|nr:aromatic ring-hydroxylating dioxygenase subunit alpha [Ktedonobacterales bacterium]
MNQPLAEALEAGYTLPTEWYIRDEYFQREQHRVFRRTWQYVGLLEQVAKTGDFFTVQFGTTSLIIVRETETTLHAFANVCRHRGSQLIDGDSGTCTTLQCRYHAWTYRLDGSLLKAPGMADEPDFHPDQFALAAVAVDTWGPFIFVNLDAHATPLQSLLGELPTLVKQTGLALGDIRRRIRRTLEIQANWKVVVDNYLECYHCPVAHPAFCDLIDINDYHVTEYDSFSTQTGALKKSAKRGKGKHGYDASQGVTDGFYAYLWPNFTLNIYPGPGNVSLNLFVPLDTHRTLAIYDYCFADAVSDRDVADFVRFIDQVQDEDTVLCEAVQRGMRSGFFEQGKLMLSRERALRHFQHLVYQSVSDE